MQYRWTLQCSNSKTGETTLETFIARDEAAAISEASRSLLLVEKVVDQQPLDAGGPGSETKPGDGRKAPR
jgi:hypothetical protein